LSSTFDSEFLEVVDTDENNAISAGVNIREGNRLQFPFDYFVENRADNRRGIIEYRMGLGGEAAFPSEGVLASIRVRGKAPVSQTAINFRPQNKNQPRRGGQFFGQRCSGLRRRDGRRVHQRHFRGSAVTPF
jgi:hypothetical protein